MNHRELDSMNNTYTSGALKQYQQIGVQATISEADPHTLITLLLQGGLQRIAQAKGYMLRGDLQKGSFISQAISIIDGLRSSLDMKAGKEIAENLDNLYEYCERRLLKANIDNDTGILDEVSSLLHEVKSAWDSIPPSERRIRLNSPTSPAG
jgi:flagellar protein FliS